MVTIQASVKTTRGRPVTGLTLAHFEVRDNGESRPILSLRSDSRSPVSVAILFDELETASRMRVDLFVSELEP